MADFLEIANLTLANKRVLLRVDFNVPMQHGEITDDTRIRETLPTLKQLLSNNAKVLIVSHFGRPKPGADNSAFSLAPIAKYLQTLLPYPVHFAADWLNGVTVNAGEVVVCENVRFFAGETENSPQLAKQLAALCDIFVMDAFGSSHRAHASTEGVAHFAAIAAAGPLLIKEITALNTVLNSKKKPTIAIVGGSKVSTKLSILEQLVTKVDILIVGGGIANTFLAAQQQPIGRSLFEADLLATAQQILAQQHCKILLPIDVIVANTMTADAYTQCKNISQVTADDQIFDIGPKTLQLYKQYINEAATILWNGPVGVFELAPFANGTQQLAHAIATSTAYSVAGGGDTIAAINQFNIANAISYISTGGGAFLEYLEGKDLPGIQVLRKQQEFVA